MILSTIRFQLKGWERDCPREGAEPRVRPGFEYDGLGAPASLTAFSMAEVRPSLSAPRMVFMTEPERKIINVGMLFIGDQFELVGAGWMVVRMDKRLNPILLRNCLLIVNIDLSERNPVWLGVLRS